jgi:hypothetical protein
MDIDGEAFRPDFPARPAMLPRAGKIVTIEWLGHGGLPQRASPDITMRPTRWSIAGGGEYTAEDHEPRDTND